MIHPLNVGSFAWPLLAASVAACFIPGGPVPRPLKALVLWSASTLVAAIIALRLGEELFFLRFGPQDIGSDCIEAIAAAWIAGQPIYPAPETGFFYGLLYGPLLYEIVAVPQWLFGLASPLAAAPGALADVAFPFVAYTALRRLGVTRRSAVLAVAATFVPLSLSYLQPGMRADPFLLLLSTVSLTLVPALKRRAMWAGLALGGCAGLAAALKLSAPIYFIPALAAANPLCDAAGRRLALPIVAGGLSAFVLPYLPQGAGLAAHWHFISELRSVSLGPAALAAHAIEVLSWIAPVIVLGRRSLPTVCTFDRLAFGALAVLPIALLLSSMEGAGLWHVMPLAPVLAAVLGRLLDTRKHLDCRTAVLVAGFSAAAVCALHFQYVDIRNAQTWAPRRAEANAALEAFVAAHPDATIAILGGQPSSLLVAAGQRLVFTGFAWADMATPPHFATFVEVQLTPCRVTYWLSATRVPSSTAQVPPQLTSAYEKADSLPGWNVWACRALPANIVGQNPSK